jgi:hypothetical protein
MKYFEVKTQQDLDDFIKSNKKFHPRYECYRNDDDYFLKVEYYTAGQEMSSIHVQSVCDLKIHIDSQKLTEAYNSLGEDKKKLPAIIEFYEESNKIPSYYNVENPCTDERVMIYFVEQRFKKIISCLNEYNESKEDDYVNLAKLLNASRGTIIGRFNNLH